MTNSRIIKQISTVSVVVMMVLCGCVLVIGADDSNAETVTIPSNNGGYVAGSSPDLDNALKWFTGSADSVFTDGVYRLSNSLVKPTVALPTDEYIISNTKIGYYETVSKYTLTTEERNKLDNGQWGFTERDNYQSHKYTINGDCGVATVWWWSGHIDSNSQFQVDYGWLVEYNGLVYMSSYLNIGSTNWLTNVVGEPIRSSTARVDEPNWNGAAHQILSSLTLADNQYIKALVNAVDDSVTAPVSKTVDVVVEEGQYGGETKVIMPVRKSDHYTRDTQFYHQPEPNVWDYGWFTLTRDATNSWTIAYADHTLYQWVEKSYSFTFTNVLDTYTVNYVYKASEYTDVNGVRHYGHEYGTNYVSLSFYLGNSVITSFSYWYDGDSKTIDLTKYEFVPELDGKVFDHWVLNGQSVDSLSVDPSVTSARLYAVYHEKTPTDNVNEYLDEVNDSMDGNLPIVLYVVGGLLVCSFFVIHRPIVALVGGIIICIGWCI